MRYQTCLAICKYTGIVAFKRSVQNFLTEIFKHLLLTCTCRHYKGVQDMEMCHDCKVVIVRD